MKRGGSPERAESGAVYNSGEQPAEQWHGRTVREDDEGYIAFMAKPDVRTALRNLAAAFTH
jgi:hypothetical protein